jgi:hypothetical protein
MPVTAKLSRRFYEQLGEDVAGELVDWFNAVDSDYREQLRQQNDLNWERFRAELGKEIAQLRAEMKTEIAGLRADMMKWMFIYWSGSMVTIAGLMLAILNFRR